MEKQSLFTRACDPCRARKIRCDKGSPCSACTTSQINCSRSRIEPAQRKKRIHVSEDIDGRLRLIEERLHHVHRLVAQVNLRDAVQSGSISGSSSTPGANDASPSVSMAQRSKPREPQEDSENEQDSDDYEGETSLQSQSISARKLLEQAVGHTKSPLHATELNKAISILQQMAEEKSSNRSRTNEMFVNAGITSRTDLSQLPLPPVDAVLYVLRKSRDISTLTFGATICTTSLQTLTDLSRAVFFCTDTYTTSTAILVHGNLFYIFHEFSLAEEEASLRASMRRHAETCRVNMEVSLSNLPLLLPATVENIDALLMGSLWSIETANTRRAWKLLSLGASLAQSLGWHRRSSLVNVEESARTRQLHIFWFLYVLDKGIALRLGRASHFQDYDIDVPLPPFQMSSVTGKPSTIMHRWIGEARVMGEVYQKLYSPGSQGQSAAAKVQIVNELVAQLKSNRDAYLARQENADTEAESGRTTAPKRVLQLIDKADDVAHHALLTIIYRVMPSESQGRSSVNRECVEAAREAIQVHMGCYSYFREADDQVWSYYMHRTLLHASFTPVLVLFCNVLTSLNRDDLARIEAFTKSIDGDHFSDAAHKLHRMCFILSQVAKLYIESRTTPSQSFPQQQQQQQQQQPSQVPQPGVMPASAASTMAGLPPISMGLPQIPATQPWGLLAPYVDAMNYAGDPMMDWGDMSSMNWTNFLSGNQSVMSILENNSPP